MNFNKLRNYRISVQPDSMRRSADPLPTETGKIYLKITI